MVAPLTGSLDERLGDKQYIADPYPIYRELRDDHPIFWSDRWGVWIVSRYEDVQAVLRDHTCFSNAGRFSAMAELLPPEARDKLRPFLLHNSAGMLQSDPPDHSRLRALVRRVFSPRVIKDIAPVVSSTVDEILSQACRAGSIELVSELAFPLPIRVICVLLGVPHEDEQKFLEWGEQIGSFQATGAPEASNVARISAAIQELEYYFDWICAKRRSLPGRDIISIMLEADEDGSRLAHSELINMCVNFLLAGHETTKSLIANAVVTLLGHQDQLDRLRQREVTTGSAVEEALRFESPVQRAWRRVSAPVSIHGQWLEPDQIVFMMVGAANRDDRVFDSPDKFDVSRADNRHLAFGSGIHHCIGAPLARIEGPIAIDALLNRCQHVELREPFTWNDNIHVRCPTAVHLELR
jgi:cytochrome P450